MDIEKLSNLFFRKGSFWGNTRWLREVRNLLINIFILSNQSHTQPLNSQDTSILGKQNLFPIQNFSIASSSVTFIEGTLLFRGNFLCPRICPVKSISRIRFWYRIFFSGLARRAKIICLFWTETNAFSKIISSKLIAVLPFSSNRGEKLRISVVYLSERLRNR